jgi:acylphosphatase
MTVRATITFTGTVQGVGFRYTTVSIARNFHVTGWVRNESDGSVKFVVEGEQGEIDRFIAAVRLAMSGHITGTRLETGPATGGFRDFSIAR